jgi:hypothetical protein
MVRTPIMCGQHNSMLQQVIDLIQGLSLELHGIPGVPLVLVHSLELVQVHAVADDNTQTANALFPGDTRAFRELMEYSVRFPAQSVTLSHPFEYTDASQPDHDVHRLPGTSSCAILAKPCVQHTLESLLVTTDLWQALIRAQRAHGHICRARVTL